MFTLFICTYACKGGGEILASPTSSQETSCLKLPEVQMEPTETYAYTVIKTTWQLERPQDGQSYIIFTHEFVMWTLGLVPSHHKDGISAYVAGLSSRSLDTDQASQKL